VPPLNQTSAPVRDHFGRLPDGAEVDCWTLTDSAGTTARILTYGATLQSLSTPDRRGRPANVVLGFSDLGDYVRRSPYFGATIGRYANRIAAGSFVLSGRRHRLALNDPGRPNCLHGGERGFSAQVWQARGVRTAAGEGVEMSRVSPDGEEGFPGTLRATVTYTLAEGRLRIEYRATADAPTIVNLTNHTYFNLAGEGAGTILDHELTLAAAHYLPVDRNLLPRGGPAPVAGTPFDFTSAGPIGRGLADPHEQLKITGGYDHCWVLDGGWTRTPRPVARLAHPDSGRVLELSTTEPGIQVYTGNTLDGTLTGPSGAAYVPYAGVALETQHYPDSPNHPEFPPAHLYPGSEYHSVTTMRFRADHVQGRAQEALG
jgi:aldose 1-epimerase